jgi:large subunit ribosomal protein L10
MRTREQKTEEVDSLRKKLGDANSVVLVDYRGLTVADANDLRGRLRVAGEGRIEYRVAKNTLLRLASEGTRAEGLREYLVGPTALALSYDEPSSLAKVLVDYAKENEKFEIKAGLVEGEFVDPAEIRKLASLPSVHELRGMLAGTVQAPLRNLAGTLHALLGNLRHALDQRREQLETH